MKRRQNHKAPTVGCLRAKSNPLSGSVHVLLGLQRAGDDNNLTTANMFGQKKCEGLKALVTEVGHAQRSGRGWQHLCTCVAWFADSRAFQQADASLHTRIQETLMSGGFAHAGPTRSTLWRRLADLRNLGRPGFRPTYYRMIRLSLLVC